MEGGLIPIDGGVKSIAAGDFDEDGHEDLAVGRMNGTVASVMILIGDGAGVFQESTSQVAGHSLEDRLSGTSMKTDTATWSLYRSIPNSAESMS